MAVAWVLRRVWRAPDFRMRLVAIRLVVITEIRQHGGRERSRIGVALKSKPAFEGLSVVLAKEFAHGRLLLTSEGKARGSVEMGPQWVPRPISLMKNRALKFELTL